MAALSGGDIPMTKLTETAITSSDTSARAKGNSNESSCITKSTSTITGQFQMGMMFTTRTRTPRTTRQTIWKRKQSRIMPSITSPTSKRRLQPLPNGTEASKELHGTSSMGRSHGRIVDIVKSFVNNAATNSRHETQKQKRDSVQTSAATMLDWPAESTTLTPTAQSAVESSARIAMSRRQLARKNVSLVSVVRVEKQCSPKDVYNLSTSDGTYFVNGVLTSNCDALRYLTFSEHCQTGITPQSIAKKHSTPTGMRFESKKFKRTGGSGE